ncbi:uncharacterized protein [Phaseolus vulgaris]|uniref:uncharacterized protein n=1 Tax=Phaseolus vulgaris TaxID=3885 RepID=UPI0035CA269A
MTKKSCYCYTVVPFGLKNAGATYQRLMDRVLAPMLGRNVQAYIDDMVVTSQERGQHVSDLEELFATIAKYCLKLNPEKCVFGFEAGARGKIPSPGEGSPGRGVLGQEASSLLSEFHGGGDDRLTYPEGAVEAGRGRKDSVLGQVYADFVVELSSGGTQQEEEASFRWVHSVDGSSNQQGSGAGMILEGPNELLIEQALRFSFKASNNQAEYEAPITGMLLAKEMRAWSLLAKSDSQLVTGQVTREYQANDPQMAAYLGYVQVLKSVFVVFELGCVVEEGDTWMMPYRRYLADGILLLESAEAKKIKKNSAKYTLVDGELYRHGFTHPILVESANKVLLRELKRRLEKAKGTWAEEVLRIVWAYHTTPQSTTGETPFSFVYGSDAMIPVEIQESSPCFQSFVAEEFNEERKVNLDLLDEVREEARIKAEALKRRVEHKHSSKIKPRQFQVPDLVMRKAHPYHLENKLSPKWTDPFKVTVVLGNGA